MKKPLHAATALLILAGCTPAPQQAMVPESDLPEIQIPTEQPITPDNSGVENTSSAVNAIELLDETLATAKTDNKRVLVHLGAKW
jgi:hypothetical protein